jgi:hypothetical protein
MDSAGRCDEDYKLDGPALEAIDPKGVEYGLSVEALGRIVRAYFYHWRRLRDGEMADSQ